jgi:hypothetical protein
MLYRVNLAWARFEPTTLVVIGTDCIGIYKSNYHMIMTTTAHKNTFKFLYIFIQLCQTTLNFYTPLVERGLYCNHLVRLSVHSHFCNRYLSFYWKKWFYIWYMAFAWWLVPYLPFPGLPHVCFLFTVRLTNERVGVFFARRSVQHLVLPNVACIFWLFILDFPYGFL